MLVLQALDDLPEVQPAEIANFFHTTKNEHFDLAYQLHGGERYSTPFIKQLGARISIGLKAPEAPQLD